MQIQRPEFTKSSTKLSQCPPGNKPEFAFIGRSNVGKSSLINMLCGRRDLAKTSSTPGKTQTINHFLIDDLWYIVDLPGYGYARVSKTERHKFEDFISEYILGRESLQCILVLIDSRLEPQSIDLEFMDWLGEKKVPFVMVFTKTDKLKPKDFQDNLSKFKVALAKSWENLPPIYFTSSEKKLGRDELLAFIGDVMGIKTKKPKRHK